VDLPSVTEPRFRLLAVSTLLQTEWARARQSWETALAGPPKEDERVPTFIVVDEAHNLIPAEARNHSELRLREQFRTVAAEGRKFGLFLILVSQRPDKLDPLVLSECENRAIMRLGSDAVLKKTTEGLGLGDVPLRMRERCLEFDVGRALIFGSWSPEATFLYSAARRTEEGGRNLRADYWAQPPADTVDLPPTASAKQNAGARKSVATAQPKKRKPRAGARKLKPT
jgi:DNA helicase HerA-like ATPase